MNTQSRAQSLYVGVDWMIYAGPDGYERSEMLAPALLLAEPGKYIHCSIEGGSGCCSPCVLHPAGKWSNASADSIVIIYFDPLSSAGRSIQSAGANATSASAALIESIPNRQLFNDLKSGAVSSGRAVNFISEVSDALSGTIRLPEIDSRVVTVAQALGIHSSGRLDLAKLSALTTTSPERLRHLFKHQVRITLSKYKAWKQLHSMIRNVVESSSGKFEWKTTPAIQQAGFYDDAHGYRTLSQYFGSRESLTDSELYLVNCIEA